MRFLAFAFPILLVLFSVVLPSSAALAQDDVDELARRHFESATAYYQTGDYDDALREFRRAYEMSHRPALLYNIYLTEEHLGHLDLAVQALADFLASDDASVEPQRAVLEQRLANLRRRAEAAASGATAEPEPGPTDVPPPRTDLVETRTDAVVAPVAPPEDRVDPAPAPTASEPPVLAIVGFTIGGLGLIGFGVAGGLALAEDQSLWASCGAACTPGQLDTLNAETIAADVLLSVGLVGVTVGIIGLLLPSGGGESARARVTPIATPTLAGLLVQGEL
jgi:tetratricopeptide (TPR) repeat protein